MSNPSARKTTLRETSFCGNRVRASIYLSGEDAFKSGRRHCATSHPFWFIAGRRENHNLEVSKISAPVPIGSSPAQVLAILGASHIEHFAYKVDPDNGRFLVAISRGSKWS